MIHLKIVNNKIFHNPKFKNQPKAHLKNFNNERFHNPKFKNQFKAILTENKYHTSIGPADLFFSVLNTMVPEFGLFYNDIQSLDLKRYLLYLIRQYDKHKNLLCLDLMYSDVLLEIKKYGSEDILYISPKNLRCNLLYIFYYYEMERNSVTSMRVEALDTINGLYPNLSYFQLFKHSSNFLNIQYGLKSSFNIILNKATVVTDVLVHSKLDGIVRKTKIDYSKSMIISGFSMGHAIFSKSSRLLSDSAFQDFSILSDIVYQTHPKTLDKMVSLIRGLF